MFSRTPGTREVYNELLFVAQQYRDAAEIMEHNYSQSRDQYTRAIAILDALRQILLDDIPIEEKYRQFGLTLNEINTILANLKYNVLSSVDVVASIVASSNELSSISKVTKTDAKRLLEAENSRRMITELSAKTKDEISSSINKLNRKAISLPNFRILSKEEAVMTYMGDLFRGGVFQCGVYAIVIDFILPILGLLILSYIAIENKELMIPAYKPASESVQNRRVSKGDNTENERSIPDKGGASASQPEELSAIQSAIRSAVRNGKSKSGHDCRG
jgi:hypothetical protein